MVIGSLYKIINFVLNIDSTLAIRVSLDEELENFFPGGKSLLDLAFGEYPD